MNILLITTDQQRFDTMAACGNQSIRTPHLDWLHDTGITFTRCYSDAPVCVPARATIMTGRHGFSQGLTTNHVDHYPVDSKTSLAGLLTLAGYQSRAVGKMHFHPLRAHHGFEHMELLPDYYRYMAANPHLGRPMDHGLGQNEMQPGISTVEESASLTRWTVQRSIDFVETRDNSRPFFLWTSFAKPHPPFDPCMPYWLMYQNAEVPEPVTGDWSATIEQIPQGFAEPTYILNSVDRFSPALIADMRRAYYACITQVDYNLGLLFARLRTMGYLEDTWIIFTSDHGEMLGDHHLGAKSVFFEGSAHVPMIIRPPDKLSDASIKGTVCDALVCLADVFPTCLSVAGVEPPRSVRIDGMDMIALARGETKRRNVFLGQCGHFHVVIEGAYKFHFCDFGASELLFDLATDPYERSNVTCERPEVLAALQSVLVDSLVQRDHPAVRDGKLVSIEPPSMPGEVRGRWPGFHHCDEECDMLH